VVTAKNTESTRAEATAEMNWRYLWKKYASIWTKPMADPGTGRRPQGLFHVNFHAKVSNTRCAWGSGIRQATWLRGSTDSDQRDDEKGIANYELPDWKL